MESQLVFQDRTEIKRLAVQNRLLSAYEMPIFKRIFEKSSNLTVLDIGCNDGKKTSERFVFPTVSKVIGLEYNQELARKAQKKYSSEKFSFYQCDAEAFDFTDKLRAIMANSGIIGFDVIYLSFILMHLSSPKKLLDTLRTFLVPGGSLIVIESNDSASTLTSDKDGLLGEFLDILKKDVYSGNRELGRILPDMLKKCDYTDITVWHNAIEAGEDEIQKKKDIFQTFFSYLPEDVAMLNKQHPNNAEYKAWSVWIEQNHKKLKHLIVQEKSHISMGMQIISCMKGSE